MIKKNTKRSPTIKWHGGKTYLANQIVNLIPDHTHYVEPFFGAGAVLFRKPIELTEGHSEVVNDVFGDLMNFWKVLQSKTLFPEFHRQVSLTPFAKPVWQESVNADSTDTVDRAVSFFIRFRQSRQGLGRDFATMSRSRTRRGMNEQVSSWLSAIDSLPESHDRLSRVAIYCDDGVDVINREDSQHTFFYCDPPYVGATRVAKNAYCHEMTDTDHQRLLDTLGNVEGRFLLSGYRHPIYDTAAKQYDWGRIDTSIDNKASSSKSKPKKVECLWSNYL